MIAGEFFVKKRVVRGHRLCCRQFIEAIVVAGQLTKRPNRA